MAVEMAEAELNEKELKLKALSVSRTLDSFIQCEEKIILKNGATFHAEDYPYSKGTKFDELVGMCEKLASTHDMDSDLNLEELDELTDDKISFAFEELCNLAAEYKSALRESLADGSFAEYLVEITGTNRPIKYKDKKNVDVVAVESSKLFISILEEQVAAKSIFGLITFFMTKGLSLKFDHKVMNLLEHEGTHCILDFYIWDRILDSIVNRHGEHLLSRCLDFHYLETLIFLYTERADYSKAGVKKAQRASTKRFDKAKLDAISVAEEVWAAQPDKLVGQVATDIINKWEMEYFDHGLKQDPAASTICRWIKHLAPSDKSFTRGRPKN